MTAANGGDALANADGYTSYDSGMCLQWVRGPCWEIGSYFGSAIDAWNGAKWKHPGDRHPPKGAPLFYSGGTYGHIVIARGGEDRMRSTDCTSTGRVASEDVDWIPQHWAGRKYLGWTEDLNGVRLPLDLGDDGKEDDMPQYDHASTGKAQKVAADQWVAIKWDNVASGPAFTDGSNVAKLAGRSYSAVVHATVEAPQGATIRMRCVEVSDGNTDESNPQTEFVATGGNSYPLYAHIGHVADGRKWAVRVSCSQPATLTAADVTVLSW